MDSKNSVRRPGLYSNSYRAVYLKYGTRGVYYGYHDPASSHDWLGGDQNTANRFYFTAAGGLYRPASSSAPLGSTPYDVAMVRRNI